MYKGKLLALVMALVLMLVVAATAGAVVDYEVLKPSNYSESRNYPVVYVMPHDGISEQIGLAQAIKKANNQGKGIDMIFVMPDFTGVTNYMSALNELVAYIDSDESNLNTINNKGQRAIIGTGVGGYMAYAYNFSNTWWTPFGFAGSVDGDFSSNCWTDTCGDVLSLINKNSYYYFSFNTYLDTPVESQWASEEGSSLDIGSTMIEMGIGSGYHEYTARPGFFDEDFMQESANRLAGRMTATMLNGCFTPVTSMNQITFKANEAGPKVTTTVTVSDIFAQFIAKAGTEIPMTLKLTLTDPNTGDVLDTASQTKKVTRSEDYVFEVSLKNIVRDDVSKINISVDVLNTTIDIGSDYIARYKEPTGNKIELMGDWQFKYTGTETVLNPNKVIADYENWDTVLPALHNWTKGYGNIDNSNVDAPSPDYFDYFIVGNAYYAKTFDVPANFDKSDIALSIGYIDDRCEVWLNGTRVGATGMNTDGSSDGSTASWSTYSCFDIDSSLINYGGKNTVVVHAYNDDPQGAGGWYAGPVGLYSKELLGDAANADGGFVNTERFFEETIYSTATGKNNKFLVYLPENYSSSNQFYPTMYLLHQFNSDHTSYKTDNIDKILDEAIKKGILDEMIVVIPNSSGMSFWTNKWAQMITEDLIPYMEKNYRVIPDARYRMTAGCSMGGQGAMGVALSNPNYFSGAASFFGAFSYADWFRATNPITVAKEETADYLNYFSTSFICGNQDSYGFGICNTDLHNALDEKNIDHHFFIENGGHDSAFYLPYFVDSIAYVRDNMYKNTSGSAASLINVEYAASSEVLTATFTSDVAIKKFFNVVPQDSEKKYTTDTNPGLTLPVVVTIKYEGGTAQVKFFVTFDDENLIVTENVDLTGVVPAGAAIHNVKFHTQLLGRDNVSDSAKVEELKVMNSVNLPQTGDNSNIWLFAALLTASVVGMAIIGKKKASC